MPRCFFALPLSDAALDVLDAHRRILEPQVRASGVRVRWVSRERMHVTLIFLGDVDAEDVAAFRDAVTPASRAAAPVTTKLGALDAFPTPRRARVLVTKIDDDAGAIAGLAAACQNAAATIGKGPEARRFRPHATLARLRSPLDVRPMLESAPTRPVPVSFDRLVLFESRLVPRSSTYVPLATLLLGARGDPGLGSA